MIDGTTGKDVSFSVKECESFLAQLPDWIFDDLRLYWGNPANFTEMLNVEVNAKN